jgi:hypothetical protein
MNKTVKIILITIATLFLLGLSVCGGAYLWLDSKRGELKAEGDRVRVEAETFAKGADQTGCLNETFRRMGACDPGELAGAICRGKESVFFTACLEHATPTPGFCDGVPAPNQIMESVMWSLKRCEAIGRPGDQGCAKMFSNTVGKFCHRRSTEPAK